MTLVCTWNLIVWIFQDTIRAKIQATEWIMATTCHQDSSSNVSTKQEELQGVRIGMGYSAGRKIWSSNATQVNMLPKATSEILKHGGWTKNVGRVYFLVKTTLAAATKRKCQKATIKCVELRSDRRAPKGRKECPLILPLKNPYISDYYAVMPNPKENIKKL